MKLLQTYLVSRSLRKTPLLIGNKLPEGLAYVKRTLRGRKGSVVEFSEINKNSPNEAIDDDDKKEMVSDSIIQEAPKQNKITESNQYFKLSSVVTPLWKVPYNNQLMYKHNKLLQQMKFLDRSLRQVRAKQELTAHGTCCELEDIAPSPVIKRYRSKDEFSIYHGVNGNSKTVGYFVGNFQEDEKDVICVNPIRVNILKQNHIAMAMAFEEFILNSPLEASYNFKDDGIWRGIVLRSNRNNELMATIVTHPQNNESSHFDEEREKLKSYFESHVEDLNLKSLYHQACSHSNCNGMQAPYHLILGQESLMERANGIDFRITPDTMCAPNIEAYEILNDIVRKLSFLEKNDILIHLNCGMGVLSLFLSTMCQRVIGLDSSSIAIKEAETNAELNGIKNVSYCSDKVENLLIRSTLSLEGRNGVLIISAGQQAINKKSIRIIREAKNISRIVISSTGLNKNIQESIVNFCKPSSSDWTSGKPFKMIYASPVDTMPQTKYSELVMLFER